PPDAGTDGAITLCSTDAAVSLFAQLGGTPDANGTWSGPSPTAGGLFDPATMSAGVYTYTVPGTAPCPDASATVTVALNTPPDAGTDGAITLCSMDAAVSLFAQLGGTPDANGTWSGPSPTAGGLFDPATMSAGVYTYIVPGTAPCPDASATVTVALTTPPDAGTDGAITLCISSPATPLFDVLGGTPDLGGIWSGPGPLINGLFDPATSTVGTYSYTVSGIAPCASASATVDVNVVSEPDPGTPNSITLCGTDSPISLFGQLGGTPDVGGTWSGPSAVSGGQFDPLTMSAGVYTYTIDVPPPCVSVSTTITVALILPPDAGSNGTLTLCNSSPSTPLLPAIGGAPDANGTWSGPSNVFAGTFDPATMIPGTYTYTVQGTAPCPADIAEVLVSVVTEPDAGSPGAMLLCTTDASMVLYDHLGGTPDPGGVWSGPSAVIDGLFDPASMLPGVYTYTIDVPPPCVNASSTVTITLAQPPNAGSDGSLAHCITSAPTALLNSLLGTPDLGGVWSGPSPVVGGLFDPTNMLPGIYTYTVAGATPCPAASAQVEVNVMSEPDPGGPGFITICSTDDAVDLFTWIEGTPDVGGTWSGPSAVIGGMFAPTTDVSGVYTYTLEVPPPCTSASTTVTVDVIHPPNAGLDGATTLCITSGDTPLFPILQGDPATGGTWTGPDGATFSGTFTPGIDASGNYTYSVAGTAPCPADLALVNVQVVTDPDPGSDGTLTLCASDASVDLFGSLGGTPDVGGIWTGPGNIPFSGTFDPAMHNAGMYTYTIQAPPPCQPVSSTVTVLIVAPPDAGGDGVMNLCATGSAVDLYTVLQGSPEAGGTWTNAAGSGVSNTFDPATDPAGTFWYTVDGTKPCPQDVAMVTINLTSAPFPGNDTLLNLCISGDPVDLFSTLVNADIGGQWAGPQGAHDGLFIPGTHSPGAYVYLVIGTAPCPSASATVTVVQLTDPDAGEDGGTILCSSNAPVDLFSLLQGTPDAGGIWLNSMNVPIGAQYDPATQPSDTVLYILAVPPPCVNDTSRVIVVVVPASDAGEPAIAASCGNGAPIDLFATLNGAPHGGGTWSGPGGSMNGIFHPGSDATGTYTYSVEATTPCPDVWSTVTVSVEAPPNAGLDGSASLCPDAPAIDLFSQLGGTPDPNGTWSGPGNTTSTGTFDPATDAPGTYTYTVWGTLCPDDAATASITIHVVPVPDAGPDAISCNLAHNLAASGTWASGSWSLPSGVSTGDATSPNTTVTAAAGGSYTFVWNTVSAEGCTSSDAVTVVFTQLMEGTVAITDAVCHGHCDGTATVTSAGGNGAYSYTWPSGIASSTGIATGLCAGSYTVMVADTNACSVSIPFTIGQPAPLAIDAVVTQPETCPGSCDGTIEVIDPEGYSYTINNDTQSASLFNGLCAGTYVVTMTNANGCIARSTALIASPPPVVPSFTYSPDTIFTSNTEVRFLNLSSSNAVSFTWAFGDDGVSLSEHPTHTFPGGLGGTYDVCLTATDANGCSNTVCSPLFIHDLLAVFVPNSFTPNGDGLNDEFLPIFNLPQVKDYQFLVFNRWGERIFGTDQPGKPWNGSYGGVASQVDVYVWKLTCKDALSGDLIERIGHVTIVQ
ncbi:MAG: T9SS type B sorting domain-containing protein, partial [Flavobacteriales bacterium]